MKKLMLDWEWMRKNESALYRRLVYEVARLFDASKSHKEIVSGVYAWAKKNAPAYYSGDGVENITPTWVGRHIA